MGEKTEIQRIIKVKGAVTKNCGYLLYVRDEKLPSFIRILISHDKDSPKNQSVSRDGMSRRRRPGQKPNEAKLL